MNVALELRNEATGVYGREPEYRYQLLLLTGADRIEALESQVRQLKQPSAKVDRYTSPFTLVEMLRERACPSGLPHTGDNPKEDHGHTDCWLHHQAADEIEQLQLKIVEYQKIIKEGD